MPGDRHEMTVPLAKLGGRSRSQAGPPLALIHGLLGSSALWRTPGMEALFARCEAVALPLPGHYPWSLLPGAVADLLRGDRLVDAYAATLRRTFDGRPVRLVGHSTGALVALEVARRYPEIVAGVCIVGALRSGRLLGSRSLARDIAYLPVIGPWAFRAALRAWLCSARGFRWGARSVMGADVPGAGMPLEVLHDLRRSDPRSLYAVALWLRDGPGLADPGRVDVPVFSIICAGDPVVDPGQQLALAQSLGRARAILLPSGHLPMVEHPAAFCDALGRWLGTPPLRVSTVLRKPVRRDRLAGTSPSASTLAH